MLRPCSHGAEKYGIDASEWRAHMCGLCVGLRDGHGQLARTATNTDAIALSVLTEAQLSGPVERTTAGPCALRGMRRASVATAGSPGVLLASTAALLLGSAKIRDHVEDGDSSVLTRRPMTRVSGRWADRARAQAGLIGLDVEPLVAAIDSQSSLEQRAITFGADGRDRNGARPMLPENGCGDVVLDGATVVARSGRGADAHGGKGTRAVTLDELTAPSQLCAAELFAHSAILANRPENVEALREAGRNFGRIAHLADAVEDFDNDRNRGRFNPLAATGTTMPEAYEVLRQSDARLRDAVAQARLNELGTVRWILLDPLTALLRRLGRGMGAVPMAHTCRTATAHNDVHAQRTDHRPPTRRPGVGQALTLVLGVYCTGYACCADHTSPCSGEREDAWIKQCDCCGGCDCCCSCYECDGCCCDC